jgi:hypothetical protein
MTIKWRKWNRILHRDIGFFIVGMCLIYSLSGIALNHIDDWNPNYRVITTDVRWDPPPGREFPSEDAVRTFLDGYGEGENYKKHIFASRDELKIFVQGGTVEIDVRNGVGVLEKLTRRPIFYEVNFLHYNPKRLWTWFSDAFCVALIVVSITGLFIIRGKKGITGRGAWLTGAGILIPLILLMVYL